MSLLIIIPIISLLNILLILKIYRSYSYRESFIASLSILSFLATIFTEFLSIIEKINFPNVTLFWFCILLFSSFLIFRKIGSIKIGINKSNCWNNTFLVSMIFMIVLPIGIISIIYPPNNWDGMTYHLPRVMHWIQNESLNHYRTHITRQIFNPPFAEVSILHTMVLTKGDYFVQLPQYLAYLGCIVGGSQFINLLGYNLKTQILTALLIATIPMALYQGNSVQNDLILGFLILNSVYFLYKIKSQATSLTIFIFSINIGLALYTKGTAYLIIAPLSIASIILLWKYSLKTKIKIVLVTICTVLLINSGHYLRNISVYGEPLAIVEGKYTNTENKNLKSLTSNFLKSLSSHLRTNNININNKIENVLIGYHRLMGVNVNEKKITPYNYEIGWVGLNYSEDYTSSTAHTLLFIICFVISIVTHNKKNIEKNCILLFIVMSILLLHFVVAWQPFITRLTLPIYIVMMVFAGVSINNITYMNWYKPLSTIIGVYMLYMSYVYTIYSSSKIIDKNIADVIAKREDFYFINRNAIINNYKEICHTIIKSNKRKIGLVLEGDTWEYPIWKILKNQDYNFEMRHIHIKDSNNRTINIKEDNFNPDIILFIKDNGAINYNVIY